MNYAGLQMVPFASPAPLAAGPALDQVPLAERRPRPRPRKQKKQKKQKPARRPDEPDIITPIPSAARLSAARSYDDEFDDDDDDYDSMDEFDKDSEMHHKHKHPPQPPTQQSLSTGVEKIKHVTRLWTPTAIIVAWTGMMLLAVALSLDSLTVSSYQPYALSSFNSHSMLPVLITLQSILSATTKPVMAKIADASGRAEALTVSLVAIILGFVINATSRSLGAMAAGQVFYAIGQVGIVFLLQIVAADTTTLANRALLSALLYSPPIVTAWVAGPVVEALVPANWRWGYGMWAVIIPVVSIPLLTSIWRVQRTRTKESRSSPLGGFISKWAQADIPGLALLVAGLVLLLLPMTLTVRFQSGWSSPSIIAMIIAGTVSLTGFVLYEMYVASHPILTLGLAKSRTVAAGCLTEALLFLSYYLWQPYLYSFLVVVNDLSPAAATNVGIAAPVVSAAVVGLAAAIVVKYSGRCKWVVVAGTLVGLVGGGLMIRFFNGQATLAQIVIAQIIAGAGSGVVSIVAQTAVQSVASHDDVANVTTLYEVARAIGGAIGTAISGSIWTRLLLSKLEEHLPEASKSSAVAIQDSFTVAASFPVGSPERLAINQSYAQVMHILLVTSIVFVAAAFLVSLAIENLNLKELDRDAAQSGVIGRANFKDWYRRKISNK